MNPGATEECNSIDDDCDGTTDGLNAPPGPFSGGSFTVVPQGGAEASLGYCWSLVNPSAGRFYRSNAAAARGSWSFLTTTATAGNSGYALACTIAVQQNTDYVLSGYFHTGGLQTPNLYLDLGDVANDPQVSAPAGRDYWQFGYRTYHVPSGRTSITVRMVRDGTLATSDRGYVDHVALTPAAAFVAPTRLCGPPSF